MKDFTIKCNIDPVSYKEKPTKQEAGVVRLRLCSEKTIVEVEPEKLLEAIEHGRSFTPAVMTGTSSKDWQSQQIVVADIDNERPDKTRIDRPLNPNEAYNICKENGIDPYLYHSFRNKEDHPKFRIMVILSEPITDPAEAKDITARFTHLFNSYTDEKCADLTMADNARFVYGSREGSVIHTGSTTDISIMRNLPAVRTQKAPRVESMTDLVQLVADDVQRTHSATDSDHDFDVMDILDFLSKTDCVDDYDKWLNVGKALKHEGYSCEVWDSWSRASLKYEDGDCESKWRSFHGSSKPVTLGTIIKYAQDYGYDFKKNKTKVKEAKATAKASKTADVPQFYPYTDDDVPPEYRTSKEPVTPAEAPVIANDTMSASPVGDKSVKKQTEKTNGQTEASKTGDQEAPATEAKKEAKKEEPEPTPAECLEEFYREITSTRFEPVPTGIDQLDKALYGGLERRTLVTISGAPGMSKTAIAQYILENMAYKGHPVVYVNLEMDRSQLLSRSIARISHQMKLNSTLTEDVTALQVRRGYKWTKEQKKVIDWSVNYYRQYIAPNFYYVTTNPENKGSIDNTLSDILKKLEKVTAEITANDPKHEAPLVCIDYLQFIDYDLYENGQRKPDNADAIKATLNQFKQFAMKHDTCVIMIIANNRASNADGRASIDSGRDTSNIEYSGDVMLSLVYTAIEEKWKYNTGKKDKAGNDSADGIKLAFIEDKIDYTLKMKGEYPLIAKLLSLKVVKGRSIMSRGVAKFIYDGRYYYFEEDKGMSNPYWME